LEIIFHQLYCAAAGVVRNGTSPVARKTDSRTIALRTNLLGTVITASSSKVIRVG
jgi:hypothetical protein